MANRITEKDVDKYIGCDLPLNKNQFGYFSPTIYTVDQVKANLKNLILTNKGERLMQPDFGCDIYSLLFENIDINELVSLVKIKISDSVKKWLPQIKIKKINVNLDPRLIDQNILKINISFLLKNENIVEELTFTIYQG